jgi:hypothetical protein
MTSTKIHRHAARMGDVKCIQKGSQKSHSRNHSGKLSTHVRLPIWEGNSSSNLTNEARRVRCIFEVTVQWQTCVEWQRIFRSREVRSSLRTRQVLAC